MTTDETTANPRASAVLDLVELERARGDKHLIRALDAEREVARLRAAVAAHKAECLASVAGPDFKGDDFDKALWAAVLDAT